jgi:anaerobic carbon-monoxide dehydrogenase iron sulfur subunit
MILKRIQVRADVCTGCRACETACVLHREGMIGTSTARIRIIKDEPEGKDLPRLCQFCDDPACISACPTGALRRNGTGEGAIRLDKSLCRPCGLCFAACSFRSIFAHPRDGTPLICDLCDGKPACVKRCTKGAIAFGG